LALTAELGPVVAQLRPLVEEPDAAGVFVELMYYTAACGLSF
jgi:hypothetical protein